MLDYKLKMAFQSSATDNVIIYIPKYINDIVWFIYLVLSFFVTHFFLVVLKTIEIQPRFFSLIIENKYDT